MAVASLCATSGRTRRKGPGAGAPLAAKAALLANESFTTVAPGGPRQ